MTLEELKKNIEAKIAPTKLIIFENTENDFIMYQYINAIAEFSDIKICGIESIDEIPANTSLFNICTGPVLYVLSIEKLEANIDYTKYNNLVIGCAKVDKALAEQYQDYIIKVPKLEEWQKKDFLYTQLPDINPDNLDKLYKFCGGNIFRIVTEIDRLKIFMPAQQNNIFDSFINDKVYDDVAEHTVFDFTNAILTKNIEKISTIYKELKNIEYSPFGILTILYSSFKNIIRVQLDSAATPESTGIKSGQFWAIKYNNIGFYSTDQLTKIFLLITSIDEQIKTGKFDTDIIIDYLLVNILGIN